MKKQYFYSLIFLLVCIQPRVCNVDDTCSLRCRRTPRILVELTIDAGLLLLEYLLQTYTQPSDFHDIKPLLEEQLELVGSMNTVGSLLQDIHAQIIKQNECSDLTHSFSQFSMLYDKISLAYDAFLLYKQANKTAHDKSLYHFIQTTRNLYSGPLVSLNAMYALVVPKNLSKSSASNAFQNDATILSLIKRDLQGYTRICDKGKSQQQIMSSLFVSVITAEAKVLSIMEFCFQKLAGIKEVNYGVEMLRLAELLKPRMHNAIHKFHEYIGSASREVWRCDPLTHVRDVTYSEFEGLIQKYLIHEEEINNHYHCLKTCTDYKAYAYAGTCRQTYGKHNVCFEQRKCSGVLHDCQDYFANVHDLMICPSNRINSHRRYDFIQSESNPSLHFGPKSSLHDCPKPLIRHQRLKGRSIYDLFATCEMCVCTCYDSNSIYIDSRPVIADENHVITGVKFVKKGQVLHLQIEQGVIARKGYVDPDSVHWKDILPGLTVVHKIKLEYKNSREFFLGIDEIPSDRILIGLSFGSVKEGNNYMIVLRTISTLYDYKTGLINKTAQGFDRFSYDVFKNQHIPDINVVNVEGKDIQIKSLSQSIPQPKHMMLVQLTFSSFQQDVGQSTIPFFDIQEVVTRPPMPLSGVGFYLKNTQGYGGFIGLKLLTYDLSKFFTIS